MAKYGTKLKTTQKIRKKRKKGGKKNA